MSMQSQSQRDGTLTEQHLNELTVLVGQGLSQRCGVSDSRRILSNNLREMLTKMGIPVQGVPEEVPDLMPLIAEDILRATDELRHGQLAHLVLSIVMLMIGDEEHEGNLDYAKECRSSADFFQDVSALLEGVGLGEADVRRLVGK